MRPVDRGSPPSEPIGNYQDATTPLIGRIGAYCSYCERRIPGGIHVEHIQPKSHHPGLEREWSNLLLACSNCNSSKGDTNVIVGDYVWPDREDTFSAFEYGAGGRIGPAQSLAPMDQARASRTLSLVGLDRTIADSRVTDRRALHRTETWGKAKRAYANLQRRDDDQMRDTICEWAADAGHWSIWMSVFRDDADMRSRLVSRFPGTAKQYFP